MLALTSSVLYRQYNVGHCLPTREYLRRLLLNEFKNMIYDFI